MLSLITEATRSRGKEKESEQRLAAGWGPPRDTWQCLETFLVVTSGRMNYFPLSIHKTEVMAAKHSTRAQTVPTSNKELPRPQMSIAARLRKPALRSGRPVTSGVS